MDEIDKKADRCRFTRPVRSQESKNHSTFDFEVQVPDGVYFVLAFFECFAQSGSFDRGFMGHRMDVFPARSDLKSGNTWQSCHSDY